VKEEGWDERRRSEIHQSGMVLGSWIFRCDVSLRENWHDWSMPMLSQVSYLGESHFEQKGAGMQVELSYELLPLMC
jgi:hypothetical protein